MMVSDTRRRALELTQEVEHSRDTPADIVRKRERAHRTEQNAKTIQTIDGFIDDHYAKRLRASAKTADRTTVELRKLGKALPGAMNRISVQDVLDWVYSELNREAGEDRTTSPATVRRKLTSLRGLFSHAIRLEFITVNPVAQEMNDNKALFDEGEGRDQWPRPDMEIRVRAALDARETRMRASHAQIDVAPRRDVVYGPDTTHLDLVRPAVVVALGEVRREIRPYRQVLVEAKIDGFTRHDLRHLFFTRLAQHGVPIERISKWLEHSNIQQTMRYAHHCPDQQRHDIRALDRASSAVVARATQAVA